MRRALLRVVAIGGTAALVAVAVPGASFASPASAEDIILKIAPEVRSGAALTTEGLVGRALGMPAEGVGQAAVPRTRTGQVKVNNGSHSISLGLPGRGDGVGVKGKFGVTFPNDDKSSTTVVPKEDGSVQILTTVETASSPTEFVYPLDLAAGQKASVNAGGGVDIVDKAGKLVGGMTPPWAKDATGRAVPTKYVVHGKSVTQIVEHTSTKVIYPVVADPWLGVDLYYQPWWYTVSGKGYKVNVQPTTWGGANTHPSIWWAHRDEVYTKMGANKWRWTTTIQEQFYCHMAGFPASLPEYNLESWRPAWNWSAMVPFNCNYPEGGWGSVWG